MYMFTTAPLVREEGGGGGGGAGGGGVSMQFSCAEFPQ